MPPSLALALKRHQVRARVAARGARRPRVSGTVPRGQDHEGSDVDLLADMPAGSSLLQIVGLQIDLCDALGVDVDLRTERELHPKLRPRIPAEARDR